MTIRTVSIDDFPDHAREHLGRVVEQLETIVLVDKNQPIIEIRPVLKPAGSQTLEALLASMPRLSPGDAEAFGYDIDGARQTAEQIPGIDPWQS